MNNGWRTVPLSEICAFQRGLTYEKSDEVDTPGQTVLRANNIDLQTNTLDLRDLRFISSDVRVPSSKYVRADTLLICTASGSKSHLGKVAYVDYDYGYAFGGFMGQIIPSSEVFGRFLYYALISPGYKDHIFTLSSGLNINNLRFDDLARFRVPVPPINEQRRIAAILDEAIDAISTTRANAETNIGQSLRLVESISESHLTQNLPDWCMSSLGDICEISSRLVDPREPAYLDLPHIGAGNVQPRTGELSDVLTARQEQLISGKFLFDVRCVLYSKIRPYLMKVVRPSFAGLCSADMYPLVALPDVLDRDFLYHLLLSKSFTDYAIKGSARAGMPKVNREHLFAYRVALPPLPEQIAIAARLDELSTQVQQLQLIYSSKLSALDELKNSLLHQAFTGQLTSKSADRQLSELA